MVQMARSTEEKDLDVINPTCQKGEMQSRHLERTGACMPAVCGNQCHILPRNPNVILFIVWFISMGSKDQGEMGTNIIGSNVKQGRIPLKQESYWHWL